jgi:transcriptional regulator with XRE-family HTH domain
MAKFLHLEELTSPLAKALGSRVRERRTALALSQAMLFEQTGVAVSYISQIERGRSNPSLDVMVALADALGVHVHELLLPVEGLAK